MIGFLKSLKNLVGKAIQFVKAYGQHLPMAAKAIFTFRVDIVCLSGRVRGGEDEVLMLYVGRRMNFPFLSKNFLEDAQAIETHSANLLNFRRKMQALQVTADVIVLDVGWPYHGFINRRGDYLELPDWLNMAVMVGDDWEAVVRSFRHTTRNNDLRLIRRNQYHCELSNDPDVVSRFYDDFYMPFVKFRHNEDMIVAPRRHVERRARQGCVLQVVGEDGVVAAGVVYPEDGVLYFLWMGMPAKYVESPPEAAISALYYFGIRYAFDHALEAVDFTGTRAFPNDGAFRFKRKWGAILEDSFSPSSILFKPANSLKAARFCERFPLVARRNDGLELVLSVTKQAFSDADYRRAMSTISCEGIDQVTVIHLSDQYDGDPFAFADQGTDVRVISCDLESFASCYADIQSTGSH